jgi:hypothetical protein
VIDRFIWVGDDLGDDTRDNQPMERGSSWDDRAGTDFYSPIKRPIGFMRRKLRVRVKAWMQPIDPGCNSL